MRNRRKDYYTITYEAVRHYREGKLLRSYDPSPKNFNRIASVLYLSRSRERMGATVIPMLSYLGYMVVFRD